jgi:hypothetical protein
VRKTTTLRRHDPDLAQAVAFEAAAVVAEKWAAQYPVDVFPGEGVTIECRAAAFARHVATHIAKDIRDLARRASGGEGR